MSDVFLNIIIALVVCGVGVAVVKFAIRKFFPEWMDYAQILLMVLGAALFVFILVQIWPLLTGLLGSGHRVTY